MADEKSWIGADELSNDRRFSEKLRYLRDPGENMI
jgi:hypothetical protein